MAKRKTIRAAVIGYGGAFGMGQRHFEYMQATPGLEPIAVCDLDPKRTRQAAKDLPGIETYTDVAPLLARSDAELVTLVTPHHTHADLAVQCLKAGKHVIVEKPMCLTVREADRMIAAAKKHKRMLSVYHNRRLDGDYLALQDIVKKDLVGRIFKIDIGMGGYGKPRRWWRSDKAVSGGALYDWGAHMVDWVLGLVPAKIDHVTGFQFDGVWRHCTNEDHSQAAIRFTDGTVAEVTISALAALPRPRWRVYGTKGAVQGAMEDGFEVTTLVKGMPAKMTVPVPETDWTPFYGNVADHLLRRKALMVKPEQVRRVIGVLEGADLSHRRGGQPVRVPHE